jgi:hypothetical protein
MISLVTLFDYTKVPVSITVGSPDSYRPPGYDTNESLRTEFEETVKQVEEGEGRFTLLQTHLAQGKMPLVLWIAQPVEEVFAETRSSEPWAELSGITKDQFM